MTDHNITGKNESHSESRPAPETLKRAQRQFVEVDVHPGLILFNFALVLAWMGVIYYFSDVPHSFHATEHYLGVMNYFFRKWAHLAEFGVLMILAYRAVRSLSNANWGAYATALGITFVWALLDEHHQSTVVGRSSSLGDVAVDLAGAFLALAMLLIIKRSD